jgi:hypothetical protein
MFKKAEKTQQKLRLALYGPSGTGKTYSGLLIAKELGARIAVVDTEHGSASKYAGDAGIPDFDVCELTRFAPDDYIKALKSAAEYDVTIVDSLSHAWMGKGGLLDQADAKGGKFAAWAELTPQQNNLVEAILAHPGHLIATMRSKTAYEVGKDDRGKTTVERLGTAAIQKDGLEYEFDVVGLMDQSNTMHVIKSRCAMVRGEYRKPGADLAKTLMSWLGSGAPAPPPSQPKPVAPDEDRIAAGLAKILACQTIADLEIIGNGLGHPSMPKAVKSALAGPFAERLTHLMATA